VIVPLFPATARGDFPFASPQNILIPVYKKVPDFSSGRKPEFLLMIIFAAIPLVIVFSLCYAATRHEDWHSILRCAVQFGGWLSLAMVIAVGVMAAADAYLH
jgi:hypothetical protein